MNPCKPSPSDSRIVREMQVRVPGRKDKRFTVLRFHSSDNVKLGGKGDSSTEVFMQRENNFKQFKGGLTQMEQGNKFGAGSEYNKDQKQEARLRRLGQSSSNQNYRAEDQPWLMTVGKGSNARKFRGIREGTVSENVQYFMFCQTKDGNFDAYPIHDWYKMSAEVNYRYLKDEEAEAEYSKLNKTKNLFNVMVKRKIDGTANNDDPEESKKGIKSVNGESKLRKNRKSFKLTDLEDVQGSDGEDDLDDDADINGGDAGDDKRESHLTAEEKSKLKQEQKEKERKKQRAKMLARKRQNVKLRKRKQNKHRGGDPYDSNEDDFDYLDDEVEDESDPDDHLGDEVDYMTNSSSDEEKLSDEELEKLYEAPGVDEEAGLKALLTDISSSEDEADNKNSKQNNRTGEASKNDDDGGTSELDDTRDRKRKPGKKKATSSSDSDSSGASDSQGGSSSSDVSSDDSGEADDDFEARNTKKLELLQQLSRNVLNAGVSSTADSAEDAHKKRKSGQTSDLAKKPRTDAPESSGESQGPESELMAAVKKYLHRKPITVVELLRKIKAKKLVQSNVDAQVALANVLKQLRPIKTIINGQSVLYLK